nr:hypothetical protein [Tanacetum cinerariifolium]
KREVEEIETLNIELDHKVTKLAAENEHLKQTYKQLYDSIKSSRVRSKEQRDDLINKVNLKSAEVSNLNESLQEKVLVITALKEQLNKLKGKAFLKMIQVRLKVPVCLARSTQQNGVVERRNRTLIEAARTMLIYTQAPLFLWAEAVATASRTMLTYAQAPLFLWAEAMAAACFTQNRSIVRLRHGKTPYELMHGKQPDLSFFHVFGALCYPTNDSENIAMASEQRSSRPTLNEMTPGTISLGLVRTSSPSTSYVPPSRNDAGRA